VNEIEHRREVAEVLRFRQFRHVLRIAETFRWFGLRVLGRGLARRPNQAGVLRLAPAVARQVHAPPVPRLTRASAAASAFHDRQFWRFLRSLRQSRRAPGLRVAPRRQFAAHVPHDTPNRGPDTAASPTLSIFPLSIFPLDK
jgi:hypothetical protein